MTHEQAIECLKGLKWFWSRKIEGDFVYAETLQQIQALDMAINALESQERQELIVGSYLIEEPSCSASPDRSDTIYRQDIYNLLDNWDESMISRSAFRCDVEDLPSAQSELIEKEAYIRGFEQGRTQGMIDSQGTDCISRQALYEILDEYDEGKIYWGEADDRIGNLPSTQPSDDYNRGWHDGQQALREEIWEDGRDRLD